MKVILDGKEKGVATLVAIDADVDPRVMGRTQIKTATWDGRVGSGAGTDTLLTATAQALVIESLTLVVGATDLSDDAWTGLSVQDNYGTNPHVFISTADGVKANLGINAQLAWTGSVYLAATQTITITAAGDDADADALITVAVKYKAVVSGGYLN